MLHFRRAIVRTCPALALLACVAVAQEPQRQELRFTYAKDAVSWHRMSSVMAMQMDMFGQKIQTDVSIEMTMHTKIVEVLESGSAKMERTVKRLQTKLSNPMMGEQLYDSDVKDADAGQMADMAVLVGVTMKMEMDRRGQIKNVKFPPELEERLSGQVSLDDLESMFAKESIVLPEQPVAIGETWKAENTMPLGGGMGEVKMAQENKLLSFANGIAVIEQKVSFGEAQEMESPMGGTMKVTGQPAQGTVELNLSAGRAEKTGTKMKLNMAGTGMNMDIDMDLQLVRIEEPKAGAKAPEPAPAPAPGPKKGGGGQCASFADELSAALAALESASATARIARA
ncbi:MAG: hypothetical protein JNM84_08540, partial [Planctomycetes bacterium]|nr:hypothetical protein [Planctomycetota bacterium]